MLSRQDEAFDTFYSGLDDRGGVGGRALLRRAWEAGRLYEAKRRIALAQVAIERYMHDDDPQKGC